jgi:transcription elongation factor Elf1
MNITRVVPAGRPEGILRCPSCGARLGEARNPAVGYLTHCGLCEARLNVRIEGPRIFVTLKR